MLTREELLKVIEPKQETVGIGGGQVVVRELRATELQDLFKQDGIKGEGDEIIMAKFTPALIAMCVVDENGDRVFSDDDIPILENGGATVITQLAVVARRLNGMAGDEAKN